MIYIYTEMCYFSFHVNTQSDGKSKFACIYISLYQKVSAKESWIE